VARIKLLSKQKLCHTLDCECLVKTISIFIGFSVMAARSGIATKQQQQQQHQQQQTTNLRIFAVFSG
jgi:hypothetical protein